MVWVAAIPVQDIEANDVTPATVNGVAIAIYDTTVGFTASDRRCTHGGADLGDGYFDRDCIECPLHQGLFDATTGEVRAAPVTQALKMYECRVRDGVVEVRL